MVKIRANLCYLALEIKLNFCYIFFNMKNVTNKKEIYESYQAHMHKLADVRSALALMQWDQETYMPIKGSGFRAQQVATLAEMAHEMATSDKLGFLLDSLENVTGLSEKEKKNILRLMMRLEE